LRLCGENGVKGWMLVKVTNWPAKFSTVDGRLDGKINNIINQWIGDGRPQGEIDARFCLTLREVY
jgi:hypothetical protein